MATTHNETMTPKERFLAAMCNRVPDRVPAAPDMSNFIPAKRTGLPFWKVYFHNEIPLWKAYVDAAEYYGIEFWTASCLSAPFIHENSRVEVTSRELYDANYDGMVRKTVIRTPDGDMTSTDVCMRADPPSPVEKPIKDFTEDWAKYKWTLTAPSALDSIAWEQMRQECHSRQQAFGVTIGYPGFQGWMCAVEGGVAPLTYAYYDMPEILDEWLEIDMENGTKRMELILAGKPDYVLLGGSGTITLASPDLARKFALPALKKWSAMAKAAGVPTMLHSCGKSRALLDMLAEDTDVNCINPLEIPPMGDVELAEAKAAQGDRISLMGNLHTTEVMLKGSPELVKRKCLEAMRDAGRNGGFILSTGDQCGRDTPEENIFTLVETAREYGVYDQATGLLPALQEMGG